MSGTGTDATGSRTIRQVELSDLDIINRDWHSSSVTGPAAHGTVVKNYAFNEKDPPNTSSLSMPQDIYVWRARRRVIYWKAASKTCPGEGGA
jgi:hypothetical protein